MKNLRYLELIIIILLTSLLIALGIWQINRFNNKRNIDFSSVPNDSSVAIIDSKELQYKLLNLEGVFLYDKEIYIYRSFKASNNSKKNIGTSIALTPFQTNNGNIIMVLRGLLFDKTQAAKPINQNTVTLRGITIPSEKDSLFIESFDQKHNIWFAINLSKIKEVLKENIITSYYLVADPENKELDSDLSPINYQDYVNLTKANYWHHLFYAINWFLMAIALCIIYAIYRRKSTPSKELR
jgi:hypothetical protein